MKTTIKLKKMVGNFAENKDIAKDLRISIIMPAVAADRTVTIDFAGISGATQSFIHALISDPIREYGDQAFENLQYKNANDSIKEIINIVYRYMQESLDQS